MPKVSVLPEHIASQIAAGEVVERPSSVVKELVENAIDAGAQHVEINIGASGRDIRVADDGCGMSAEDAVLAFQRHATSKIKTADDLSALSTLGFRGEALPSVASISKFTCFTRTKEDASGTRVDLKDGTVTASSTGCAPGTVMEIKDLFFNVPARLKFLKAASTEFAHIQEIVQSLAIAHPSVAIELKKNESTVLKTTGSGDLKKVIVEAKLFSGKESLIEVIESESRMGLKIHGYVARPTHFRGDRKAILSIVNSRPVRCPLTYKALDYAYSDLIPRGRYPLAVLAITIDPEHIDVNIHPTKKEIKYSESNTLYLTLNRALSTALREPRRELAAATSNAPGFREQTSGRDFASLARDFESSSASSSHGPSALSEPASLRPSDRTFAGAASGMSVYEEELSSSIPTTINATTVTSLASTGSGLVAEPSVLDSSQTGSRFEHIEQLRFAERLDYKPDLSARPEYIDARNQQLGLQERSTPSHNGQMPSVLGLGSDAPTTLPAGWRLAGYIHNTYFLFETPDGMEIVEQHISHERTLYERLLARQTTPGRMTENVQQLCISAPLHLTPEQSEVLSQSLEHLRKLGFDFVVAEGTEAACTQVPQELAQKDYVKVIQKMLDDLVAVDAAHIDLEATKSVACQAAVKNGMTLSYDDIIRLVSAWLATPRNDTCPHGRPIRLKFPMKKLFELFHPA